MNICDKLAQQSFVLNEKLKAVNGLLETIEEFISDINFSELVDDLPMNVYQYDGTVDKMVNFMTSIANVNGDRLLVTAEGLVGYFDYTSVFLEGPGEYQYNIHFIHGLSRAADDSNAYLVARFHPNRKLYLYDIVINVKGEQFNYSFPELINNLVSNISDIELSQKITELASLGQLNLTSFKALMSTYVHKTDFIQEIDIDLTNMLSQINEEEAAVSVLSYFKKKLGGGDGYMHADEVNNKIEFSELATPLLRSSVIPWGQIASNVGQIVGLAIGLFNPVIGLAVTGTCTILSKVSEIIQNATGNKYELLTERKARGNRYTNSPMFQTMIPMQMINDQQIRNLLMEYGVCKAESALYTVYLWCNDTTLDEQSLILIEAFPSFYVRGNTGVASSDKVNNLLNSLLYSFNSNAIAPQSEWKTTVRPGSAYQNTTILRNMSQAVQIGDAHIYDMEWFSRQPMNRLSRMMTFFHSQWNLLLLSIVAKLTSYSFPTEIACPAIQARMTEKSLDNAFGPNNSNRLANACSALSCYITICNNDTYGSLYTWDDEQYQYTVDNINILNINYVPQIVSDYLEDVSYADRSTFLSFFIPTLNSLSIASPSVLSLSNLTDADYNYGSRITDALTPSISFADKGQARILCPSKIFNIWLEVFAVAATVVAILLVKRAVKNRSIARRTRKQLKLERDILSRKKKLIEQGGTQKEYMLLGKKTTKYNNITRAICQTPSAPSPIPEQNNLLSKVSTEDIMALSGFAATGDVSFLIDKTSEEMTSESIAQKLQRIKQLIKYED